jgi:RNA polymerase sigma-70 factor (ECF subfamily)
MSAPELLQSAFRYALALSHHPEDAEDLVQEAWMNLRRKYGCVESRAVLFAAVRHLFIDQCRRRKIVQFESLDDLTAYDAPAEQAAEPGVKGDLDALLAVLRPAERETLFLHYHQGHTAEEIGQLTGQPRNSVLSIIHRAIRKLRVVAASDPVSKLSNHIVGLFVTFL